MALKAAPAQARVHLVFLGAGKTALIRRFLQGAFEARHRRTVEELHVLELEPPGPARRLRLELLDSSGSYSFPANKSDLGAGGESGARLADTVRRDWGARRVEASAKQGHNVAGLVQELLNQVGALRGRLSPALRRRSLWLPRRGGDAPSKAPAAPSARRGGGGGGDEDEGYGRAEEEEEEQRSCPEDRKGALGCSRATPGGLVSPRGEECVSPPGTKRASGGLGRPPRQGRAARGPR